jgi:hypothetical protein
MINERHSCVHVNDGDPHGDSVVCWDTISHIVFLYSTLPLFTENIILFTNSLRAGNRLINL